MKRNIKVLIVILTFLLMICLAGCSQNANTSLEKDKDTEENVSRIVDKDETESRTIVKEKSVSSGETISQTNAVDKAKSYLDYTAFSKKGLIEQLEFEGFNNADATYAVNNISVDWEEQAVKTAKSYLDYSSFSEKGLIEQLEFEGFSNTEASYAVEEIGLSSEETTSPVSEGTVSQTNAVDMAKSYLDYSAFSEKGLIEQLEFEGFSNADATYAINNISVDWREQAVKMAKSYLDYSSFSRSGLIEQLKFEGFSNSDANHAADKVGF